MKAKQKVNALPPQLKEDFEMKWEAFRRAAGAVQGRGARPFQASALELLAAGLDHGQSGFGRGQRHFGPVERQMQLEVFLLGSMQSFEKLLRGVNVSEAPSMGM